MIKTILIVLFVIVGQFVFSQNYQIEWNNCYGGSASDNVYDIIELNSEFYILGGTGSNDGDISYNHGQGDVWLVKTDSTGSIIWEKTYGGSDGEIGHRIFFNNENGFYILARTGSDDGDISYNPFPNSVSFWILKLDIDGNIIWEKVVGGNGPDDMSTGTVTNDGGIVAMGYSGSEYGDVSINYGLYDIWMIKLSSEGEIEWDFTMGTDGQDFGQAIIQTYDGGFLVGGASKLTGGGNLNCECNGQADGVLVKLDSDRNIEWQECYGGSDSDGIWGMMELNDGYLISAYGSSNDGDLTGSGWHGSGDIWVIKINLLGEINWQKCYGGSASEAAKVIYELENSFVLFGSTRSQNGDVTNNHSVSEFDYDIWFLKIDSTGELLYQSCYGGGGNDFLEFGVVKKGDNNYVIAAYTDYGPSYDVGCTPHGGNGDEDWWVFEIKDTTVGVQETTLNQQLKAYPNPASNYVIFEFPTIHTASSVALAEVESGEKPHPMLTITNTLGQQVAQLEIKDTKTVWDTRQVYSGVYFYRVVIENTTYSGKTVIQR
jgi:hypothetical protein